MAYWLIGREIVQELQGGEERAGYGKQVLENLSRRLTERYCKGFSATNLKYFRRFYQTYSDRMGIRYPAGDESENEVILSPSGIESQEGHPPGDEIALFKIFHPSGGRLVQGFSPQLTWSHYREYCWNRRAIQFDQ